MRLLIPSTFETSCRRGFPAKPAGLVPEITGEIESISSGEDETDIGEMLRQVEDGISAYGARALQFNGATVDMGDFNALWKTRTALFEK